MKTNETDIGGFGSLLGQMLAYATKVWAESEAQTKRPKNTPKSEKYIQVYNLNTGEYEQQLEATTEDAIAEEIKLLLWKKR